MSVWMIVIGVVLALLLARAFLLPRLVARWVRRLRADPASDSYNETSAYGLPGFDPVHTELDRVELPVSAGLPGSPSAPTGSADA